MTEQLTKINQSVATNMVDDNDKIEIEDSSKVKIPVYSHFIKPLEFRNIEEVDEYLKHHPFSYDEPPVENKEWKVLMIRCYRETSDIKSIIEEIIKEGGFKRLEPPKFLQSTIKFLVERNISRMKTKADGKKEIFVPALPTVYYINVLEEINVLLAIKQKLNHNIIILSMDDSNLRLFYEYVFFFAELFGVAY